MQKRQESPADTDKPERRESMPKIAPIPRVNKLQTSSLASDINAFSMKIACFSTPPLFDAP